jgi:hypothetical protein
MEPQTAASDPVAVQRCPACRDKVVVDRSSEVVIHNAILRIDRPSGRVTAKCRRCKAWVEVPLRYLG